MSYFKITSEIQGMVLTLSINFLPFSSVKNLFRYSETFGSKLYDNLFGCLSFERLNLKRLSEKRHNVFWKFSTCYLAFSYYRASYALYALHVLYAQASKNIIRAMSALRDLRILDIFVILVDYFALFVKI